MPCKHIAQMRFIKLFGKLPRFLLFKINVQPLYKLPHPLECAVKLLVGHRLVIWRCIMTRIRKFTYHTLLITINHTRNSLNSITKLTR